MPYATSELLAEAGRSLRGAHNFAVVTFPALLREARREGQPPTQLVTFGSTLERQIYDESFSLGDPPKPYLSVWGEPPAWVGSDNARKGLQAQRTRDAFAREVFIDDADAGRRTKFALKPHAGRAMLTKCDPVRIVDLAAWLARGTEFDGPDELVAWFRDEFPADGTDLFGTLYLADIPPAYRAPAMWADAPADREDILTAFGAPPTPAGADGDGTDGLDGADGTARPVEQDPLESAVVDELDSLEFSRSTVDVSLRASTISDLAAFVERRLEERNIILPDQSALVRRCVVALLTGHLVLQGPPGTGKTTLARILAEAFDCLLEEVTATSEWTPFNVVGGYRMSSGSGGLRPHYGHLTSAVMRCAEVVHADQEASTPDEADPTLDLGDVSRPPQAVWLLIDEFNRADIDKAIGSLYTLLGSTHPDNLARSPLDLWFEEEPGRRRLWVPGRFRIIGSMNDLDTAFVNRISQGLTRRFQFITVGVPDDAPTSASPVTNEVVIALAQARNWVQRVYGLAWSVPDEPTLRLSLDADLKRLSALVSALRQPTSVPGWPVGTAQLVDVLRTLVIEAVAGEPADALDRAVADRLVPQMGTIDDDQFEQFKQVFEQQSLLLAAAELRHLIDPHLV